MKSQASPKTATDTYFELVRCFPLRRLRNPAECAQAVKISGRLLLRGDAHLDEGELQYLDALAYFIMEYQGKQKQMNLSHLTPLQKLTHLMEESGLRSADLGRLLGSQPTASLVLHGKRELSKNHIRKLAAHFKVDAGYFI